MSDFTLQINFDGSNYAGDPVNAEHETYMLLQDTATHTSTINLIIDNQHPGIEKVVDSKQSL